MRGCVGCGHAGKFWEPQDADMSITPCAKDLEKTAGVEKFYFCMQKGSGHKSLMKAMLDRVNASDLASDMKCTKSLMKTV